MGEREVPLAVLIRYFRVPTADIPVDYPGREVLLGSRITNISVTGVFVRTNKPLEMGAQVEIAFRLPESERLIRCKSVVRWRSFPRAQGGEGDAPGMGLEFSNIKRRDQKAVEKFVRDFLLRMRKGHE